MSAIAAHEAAHATVALALGFVGVGPVTTVPSSDDGRRLGGHLVPGKPPEDWSPVRARMGLAAVCLAGPLGKSIAQGSLIEDDGGEIDRFLANREWLRTIVREDILDSLSDAMVEDLVLLTRVLPPLSRLRQAWLLRAEGIALSALRHEASAFGVITDALIRERTLGADALAKLFEANRYTHPLGLDDDPGMTPATTQAALGELFPAVEKLQSRVDAQARVLERLLLKDADGAAA